MNTKRILHRHDCTRHGLTETGLHPEETYRSFSLKTARERPRFRTSRRSMKDTSDRRVWRAWTAGTIFLATLMPCAISREVTPSAAIGLERGVMPARWTDEKAACDHAPAFRIHEYNPTFFILRQSGCTNFEKPFLYLLLGSQEALLVDTGAPGADVSRAVEELLHRGSLRQAESTLPLLVIHSHGHGDHTAGDAALRGRKATRVIDAQPQAILEFFHLKKWPGQIAQYDLGNRMVDIVPIPGHQPASVAIYDRRTGLLLTGDTLYPGRLYVRDAPAFVQSIDRLVDFTWTDDVRAHPGRTHREHTHAIYGLPNGHNVPAGRTRTRTGSRPPPRIAGCCA